MKSNIKLKGKYTFTLTLNIPSQGTIESNLLTKPNRITEDGSNFVLRRLYSSTVNPINYIAIAKNKSIETLKENSIVKTVSSIKSTSNRSVEFHATFTSTEMAGIEQIWLTNKEKDGVIITHSTLNKPFTELPEGVTVTIKYELGVEEGV